MIDAQHSRLSLVRECTLLSISRGSVYYQCKGESALHLELMREQGEPIPDPTTQSAYVDVQG